MSAPDPTAGERERCTPCGPGYRIGDDGCRHTPASPPAVAASTGTSEDVEALAKMLADHRAAFQCDGDYGEMQWVECTCGSDYYLDTDAGYAEHEAHLAAVLADREAAARAEVLREALAEWEGGPTGQAPIPRWWLEDRAAREGRP